MFGLPVSANSNPVIVHLSPRAHTVLADGVPLLTVAPGVSRAYAATASALVLEMLHSRPDVAAALAALAVLSAQSRAHG